VFSKSSYFLILLVVKKAIWAVNIQTIIPAAVINKGYKYDPVKINSSEVDETNNAAQVDSAKDPNKSEPIPAISPTLSPTLSAIHAGFLG